jgi:hypothetical protein
MNALASEIEMKQGDQRKRQGPGSRLLYGTETYPREWQRDEKVVMRGEIGSDEQQM